MTNYHLFLSVLPGLEDFCRKEVKAKLEQFQLEEIIVLNDLTLSSSKLYELLNFIKYLRVPTRALLRIEHFVARDLPKLYKKLSKITWNDYLVTKNYDVKISSQSSRLFDDRKIEQALRDAIADYQKAQPYKAKYDSIEWDEPPKIFLRFENDQCQVSIDLSGKRLDMRGYKIATAKAPMRESLAYALLMSIGDTSSTLVDPMAGSGTIISEYLNFNKINNRRSYNFENFPIYRRTPPVKLWQIDNQSNAKAWACDINKENISAINDNLNGFDNLKVLNEDFFKRDMAYTDDFIIACNLPYGKRIKTKENIHHFVEKFLRHGFKLGAKAIHIVVPETFIIDTKKFKVTRSPRINNGGIWIQFIKVVSRED